MSSNRRRRRWPVVVPIALLIAVLGGYVAADVVDVLPGVLTMRPTPAPPSPYPDIAVPAAAADSGVPGPDESAATPSAEAVAALAQTLLATPEVGGTAGVLVSDVATGTDLQATNAEQAHVPASTTKLLTATAAIAAAGSDYRFQTRVVQAEPGQIVLVGGGDLTLAAGAGDPTAIVGHAGLGDLAAQTAQALTAAGVTEVSVGLDTTYYTGEPLAPRWDAIDLGTGDAMYMAPLAIDIGVVKGVRPRDVDPSGKAAAIFAAALTQAGIAVTGDVTSAAAPADGVELAAVSSAPLADVVAYMLQHSENILAEGIGRLVAHETGGEPSFIGAGLAIIDVLAGLNVSTEGLSFADSAGLSSTNQISPRTLVDALVLIADNPAFGAVSRGLPVAGLEGTLSDRLTEAPAAGMVNAKTGTLREVVSLAGFVTTADGRLLAFAVLAGDVPSGGTINARDAVDTFAAGLAACGC